MGEPPLLARPVDAPLPPGADGLPLLGDTLSIAGDTFGFYDRLAEFGVVVTYRVAGKRFVTLLHPDHVEHVLLGEPEKFHKWSCQEVGVDLEGDPEPERQASVTLRPANPIEMRVRKR